MTETITGVLNTSESLEESRTIPNIRLIKSALLGTNYILIHKDISDRKLWCKLLNVHDEDLDEAYTALLQTLG